MTKIANGKVTFKNGAVFTCAELVEMFGSVDEAIFVINSAI